MTRNAAVGPARATWEGDVSSALRLDEAQARAVLERLRWADGVVCPHCNGRDTKRFRDDSTRSGVHKCKGCRRQFTVTVGTIMHGTRVPLNRWLAAFSLACHSRRGVSALELKERLSLGSYETAWNMARRMLAALETHLGQHAEAES
jgi:transposase-like protein